MCGCSRGQGGDCTKWVECVAWSPNALLLAVGSADCRVYVYNTTDWSAGPVFKGAKYGVAAMDFSADSVFIRACCFGPVDGKRQSTVVIPRHVELLQRCRLARVSCVATPCRGS